MEDGGHCKIFCLKTWNEDAERCFEDWWDTEADIQGLIVDSGRWNRPSFAP